MVEVKCKAPMRMGASRLQNLGVVIEFAVIACITRPMLRMAQCATPQCKTFSRFQNKDSQSPLVPSLVKLWEDGVNLGMFKPRDLCYCVHTHPHTHIHTCTNKHMYMHTYIQDIYIHTHTHTHTQYNTIPNTYIHTHNTIPDTYIHTYIVLAIHGWPRKRADGRDISRSRQSTSKVVCAHLAPMEQNHVFV